MLRTTYLAVEISMGIFDGISISPDEKVHCILRSSGEAVPRHCSPKLGYGEGLYPWDDAGHSATLDRF